jgi:hypothetical protein
VLDEDAEAGDHEHPGRIGLGEQAFRCVQQDSLVV